MEWRGFTLVELMVVLAVGSILLAIAVPGYANFMNFNRLVTLTNDMVSSLQMARSEAIKRGKRVTVCKSSTSMAASPACEPSAGWQHGWIVFVDEGTKGVMETGDLVLKVHGAASDSAVVSASNFSSYASYLPDGTSQGPNGLGNGALHLCLAGGKRSIIINTTGRIRIAKGTC